jgi:hypothetical protein
MGNLLLGADNPAVRCIFCVIDCCLDCFTRFMEFINKNAYTIIAFEGIHSLPPSKHPRHELLHSCKRVLPTISAQHRDFRDSERSGRHVHFPGAYFHRGINRALRLPINH